MTNATDSTRQALAALGVASAEAVAERFAELRAEFDRQAAGASGADDSAKVLRDSWMGRKSGVLTRITENWLKSAGPALRPAVGKCLNELRGHVEQRLEELQRAGEAAAESTAAARERADLSLPGVTRPLGSRHLLRQTFADIERIFLSL